MTHQHGPSVVAVLLVSLLLALALAVTCLLLMGTNPYKLVVAPRRVDSGTSQSESSGRFTGHSTSLLALWGLRVPISKMGRPKDVSLKDYFKSHVSRFPRFRHPSTSGITQPRRTRPLGSVHLGYSMAQAPNEPGDLGSCQISPCACLSICRSLGSYLPPVVVISVNRGARQPGQCPPC